jgi:hypothetical protein
MSCTRASAVLAVLCALVFASVAHGAVVTYPAAATIAPTGPLPPDGGKAIALNTGIGEFEDGIAVVSGAHTITAVVDKGSLGGINVQLLFGHFVNFGGGRLLADALMPWDGTAKGTERSNQPVWVQVEVPLGTNPGTYSGTVTVTADGKATNVPLTVKVFPVTIPPPAMTNGNLLTSFLLSAETYLNTDSQLYGFKAGSDFLTANNALYGFLSKYRVSPSSWGYGEPHSEAGYTTDRRWWKDSMNNMAAQIASSQGFTAMRLPVSNNRASRRASIAGLDPFHPEGWCPYLEAVHSYWEQHNFLNPNIVPYLYGMDEPGAAGFQAVQKQAAVAHKCFPGSRELVTGNPTANNSYLWDNKGGDDVDIWVVLANRFYGKYTNPTQQKLHSRAREKFTDIQQARARGKMVWAYNYQGTGTPGFAASEPVSNPRLFFLWAALEGVQGILYEAMTNYTGNPFASIGQGGGRVLIYPGPSGPIASARFEQIRNGIEDWAIFNLVRQKHGASRVWQILGDAGLFSASASGVQLGCTVGCDLKSSTPFSWPLYSHDASTPARIEAAKLQALQAAR